MAAAKKPATKKKPAAKKSAAPKKPAAKKPAAKKPVTASASATSRVGRGTRWTEAQVKHLLETVSSSPTAKQAFEQVAKELGKSVGTVQQKYYNVQKASGAKVKRRRGRPAGSTNKRTTTAASATRAAAAAHSGTLSAVELRSISVDELVALATRVRAEVDRRRRELDQASKLFG